MSHQRRHRLRHRKPGPLNLVACIDIVFLLLVFFVVTASFATGEGVLTNMPIGPDPHPTVVPPPSNPIRIRVAAMGAASYRLDIQQLPASPRNFAELQKALRSLHERGGGPFTADNAVLIDSAGKARWQHVLNAYNAAVAAGFTNIAFSSAVP